MISRETPVQEDLLRIKRFYEDGEVLDYLIDTPVSRHIKRTAPRIEFLEQDPRALEMPVFLSHDHGIERDIDIQLIDQSLHLQRILDGLLDLFLVFSRSHRLVGPTIPREADVRTNITNTLEVLLR